MRYFVGVDGKYDFLKEQGSVPVIIDVLRATSTIVAALWSGAARVIPVVDADEALQLGKGLDAVLIGERNGVKIEGFDYNNSPGEMLNAELKGRIIVITTSNGTRIMTEGGVIGSTLNAGAVAGMIMATPHAYLLATGPEKSDEDLCAARIIEFMADELSAQHDAVNHARSDPRYSTMIECIRHSFAGEKLSGLGYGKDVEMICAGVNNFPIVPIYRNGSITIKK